MSTKSYVVKMVAGDSDSTRIWNSKKPMSLGHPARWSLEATDTGVRIRPLQESGRPKLVKNAELEKTASIVLVPGTKNEEGFRIELQPLQLVRSAFSETSTEGAGLRIFHCKGEWNVDTQGLGKKYVARYENKKVFILSGQESGLYTSGDMIDLKPLVDGVMIDGKSLPRGEKRRFSHDEAKTLTVTFQDSAWKLSPYEPSREEFPVVLAKDQEHQLFQKTLKWTAAALFLIFGLSFIFTPAPELKKDEKVTILLTPKKKIVKGLMTAAPKGDSSAKDFSIGKKGDAKNAGRKGGDSKKKVAKAEKAAKPVKKVAAKKSAPAKAGVKKGPKKVIAKKGAGRAKSVPQAPKSQLFQTFSSAAFRKASQSLVAGGIGKGVAGSDPAAEARSMGNSSGSGRGAIGSANGISTRSGTVSGFGSGGNGDGGPGSAGAGYGRGSYSKVSGQGRSFVSLDTGASDVDEGLTRDQVGRVIHAHMNEIRYCYESAVLRENSIEGKMQVNFSIGAPGKVRTAGVASSTVGDRRLHNCIVSRLKTWQFPKPKGGVTVAVTYPFMFKTLAQ